MLVMGQAVYNLGPGNKAVAVVPKEPELLRKELRRKNFKGIERLSGRTPIIADYDPRLDDGRIERFLHSPGLRKYPRGVFALRAQGDKNNRWVFVSDKKRKRIFLVPLSMVPEVKL